MRVIIDHDRGTRPLAITATLAERILVRIGDLPQIDGIFAVQRLRMLGDERPEQIERHDPRPAEVGLRLAKWRVGDLWGYVVTEPLPVGEVRYGRAEIRKMPDTDAMAELTDAPSVTVSAGATKAYDLTLPTVQCSALKWWVIGKSKEIRRRYLRLDAEGRSQAVHSIGSKRGLGFGRVLRWAVDEAPEVDADWILARRWMPEGYREGRTSLRGIRPPYWHPARQVTCVEPAWD